jgi:hypothetical protein
MHIQKKIQICYEAEKIVKESFIQKVPPLDRELVVWSNSHSNYDYLLFPLWQRHLRSRYPRGMAAQAAFGEGLIGILNNPISDPRALGIGK